MKRLLILFVFCFSTLDCLFGQELNIDESIFEKYLLNSAWSNSDDSSTIILFVIKEDSVELTILNWAEGFGGIHCKYQLSIKENIFGLKMYDCEDNMEFSFIYGYLRNDGALLINLFEEEIYQKDLILGEDGWTELYRYKE